MNIQDVISLGIILAGCFFVVAGIILMLRAGRK